jgi:hypothetical protein
MLGILLLLSSCLLGLLAYLMKDAARSSETSVNAYIPEDTVPTVDSHRSQNLKSNAVILYEEIL